MHACASEFPYIRACLSSYFQTMHTSMFEQEMPVSGLRDKLDEMAARPQEHVNPKRQQRNEMWWDFRRRRYDWEDMNTRMIIWECKYLFICQKEAVLPICAAVLWNGNMWHTGIRCITLDDSKGEVRDTWRNQWRQERDGLLRFCCQKSEVCKAAVLCQTQLLDKNLIITRSNSFISMCECVQEGRNSSSWDERDNWLYKDFKWTNTDSQRTVKMLSSVIIVAYVRKYFSTLKLWLVWSQN